MKIDIKMICATLILPILAGCGGAGAVPQPVPPITPVVELSNLESIEQSRVVSISLDAPTMSIASQSGVLDRADNRLDVDGLSGTISTSRTWVVLDEGGIATLTYDPRTYFAARFVTEPSAGSRTVGVVGVATSANTLPSGTANYAGSTTMTVQSGSNLYELEGDATITAQFGGSGSVQTKLNSLDGTVSTGNNAPTSIANFGDITVSGSVIEGSSFSGGTVDVRSNFITVAADGDVVLEGQFFGFRASEVGGVLVVDDSLTGNTRIFADFLAQ